jgi:hypothetical protein
MAWLILNYLLLNISFFLYLFKELFKIYFAVLQIRVFGCCRSNKIGEIQAHSINVRHNVDSIEYENTTGWYFNTKGINDGDSVWLKYAVEDPRLIITELEKAN